MTIIIPMAGLSSRFRNAGYTLPKYMLYVKNKSLFNLAVSSFENYFMICKFIFIVRDVYDTPAFIKEECRLIGIDKFEVIVTDPTRGQAETVLKGLKSANPSINDSILIFNIDTIRPGFKFPSDINKWDGYLECFIGNGTGWSYAKTEDGTPKAKVIETAEKNEISNFCSTGIYYFKNTEDYINAYNENEITSIKGVKELYVAPLYNYLIKNGKNIHVNLISSDEVFFCGTPQEYDDYLKSQIISEAMLFSKR